MSLFDNVFVKLLTVKVLSHRPETSSGRKLNIKEKKLIIGLHIPRLSPLQ